MIGSLDSLLDWAGTINERWHCHREMSELYKLLKEVLPYGVDHIRARSYYLHEMVEHFESESYDCRGGGIREEEYPEDWKFDDTWLKLDYLTHWPAIVFILCAKEAGFVVDGEYRAELENIYENAIIWSDINGVICDGLLKREETVSYYRSFMQYNLNRYEDHSSDDDTLEDIKFPKLGT